MTSIVHHVLGLTCETPLHAGGGSKEAVIDLPIQREAHTGWPCVYGSAMKGALRARAEQLGIDKVLLEQAFGPDTENASDHAGALIVSDARLLLLPVRSLTTYFKRVTCPALLRRLLTDLARAGCAVEGLSLPSVDAQQPMALGTSSRRVEELYLEEFRFAYQHWDSADQWLEVLTRFLGRVAGIDAKVLGEELKEQLVVVDDDSFTHLCRSALPILPHIRINSATKTVATGALWYEENLPADTVLYTVLGCQPSRKKDHELAAGDLMSAISKALFTAPYIQIGGNETTGMGWCRVADYASTEG